MAGGISGCPDWQREICTLLSETSIVFLNPRRSHFSLEDASSAPAQIEWEFRHLRIASAILFWFPAESLCPIALYELGAWSMTEKSLFVGVDPDYARRSDIEIQTRLVRGETRIATSLAELAQQIVRSPLLNLR